MLSKPELDMRDPVESLQQVTRPEELVSIQHAIKRAVFVSDPIKAYIVRLVRATRHPGHVPELQELTDVILRGASPRGGTLNLRNVARVHAFLDDRSFVLPEDVRAVVPEVLRHRLSLTFQAESEGVTVEEVLDRIVQCVEIP